MTQPPRDLTAAVFRALNQEYDLRTCGGLHIVTPKGTPVHISESLGQIACSLSAPQPDPGPAVPPDAMPLPAPRRPGPGPS